LLTMICASNPAATVLRCWSIDGNAAITGAAL
jgi:hypothetical protein